MAIELRDGTETNHRALDRLVYYDERSRAFPISAVVPEDIRTRTWRLDERLDQLDWGACVGHGFAHEVAAAPAEINVPEMTHQYALDWYFDAQKIDPWAGGEYPGAQPRMAGTSVLAGVKIGQQRGFWTGYRWAFSIEDVLRAVANEGPVVVGTWWRSSMWQPRPSGLIEDVSGAYEGGHCYMIRGLTLKPRLRGESGLGPVLRITNSWSRDWGVNGEAFIRVEDFEKLLLDDGEAVLPVGRQIPGRRPRPAQSVAERSPWVRSWIESLPWRTHRG